MTTSHVRRDRWRDGGLDRVPVPGVAGELWLCGKHVVGADPDAALERIGGPGTDRVPQPAGRAGGPLPGYVDWLRRHDGTTALWFPSDLHAPALDDLRPLLAEIGRRLAAGDHVLIHCGAGIGRAGTLAVAC